MSEPKLADSYDALIYANQEVQLLDEATAKARRIRLDLAQELIDEGDATVSSLARLMGMRRETLSLLLKRHREEKGRV